MDKCYGKITVMDIRYLINDDGAPFDSVELQTLRNNLDVLGDEERTRYRNQNASAIARHGAIKFLIVSGPGTGKSHLFLERIVHWYETEITARVLVTSFVRKLVADLQSDIERNQELSRDQKNRITATTLHKYARSIVEKHHGTAQWPFNPHFRIIGQSWKDIVWADVLGFHPGLADCDHTWKTFEKQLHNSDFDNSQNWRDLKEAYFRLCKFYNAAGFADLILRATRALTEDPHLNEYDHYILDEYQDFNRAEETLIDQLVQKPKGLLIVGDDEQVLYETLKSGDSTLIRDLYRDTNYANGMLPFCSRSTYHITKSADHFIRSYSEERNIEKIYLPLRAAEDEPRVRIIACAIAPTAADYIEKFVSDHKTDIDERKRQLASGEAKDAFLLILTPAKEVDFYGNAKRKIRSIVAEYQTETRSFSDDYYKLLSYYSLPNNPHNNFTFRKVLHYEDAPGNAVHTMIAGAMQGGIDFCDLDNQEIKDALTKCNGIKTILEDQCATSEKLERIAPLIRINDREKLLNDLERKAVDQKEVARLDHEEEETAELEDIEAKCIGAVELMTIVGSKGLSADHVIIIGFDNVNMKWVTKNAFYVAMTRARKSLHMLVALKSGGANGVHSFFDRLPSAHVEYCKYKKSTHAIDNLPDSHSFKKYLLKLNSFSR